MALVYVKADMHQQGQPTPHQPMETVVSSWMSALAGGCQLPQTGWVGHDLSSPVQLKAGEGQEKKKGHSSGARALCS